MTEPAPTAVRSSPVRWWGSRVARFGILLVALAALLLAPIHLTQSSALVVAVPALVFFVAWALLFAIIWAAEPAACAVATTRCDGAFTGLGHRPLLGDFVYYAVNVAFANPPPDVVAESRTARAAATVEIVAATGFLAVYLGAFLAGRGLTATATRPPDSA